MLLYKSYYNDVFPLSKCFINIDFISQIYRANLDARIFRQFDTLLVFYFFKIKSNNNFYIKIDLKNL